MTEDQILDAPLEDEEAPGAETLTQLTDAIQADARTAFLEVLEPLHAADIADLLEQASSNERADILEYWGADIEGEVLSEMEAGTRADALEQIPDEIVSEAVKDLDTDDVVDLLENMEQEQRSKVLDALDDADELAVRRSLEYPEYTAGRLMQRELVLGLPHWTVGDAIDDMRRDQDLPNKFYDMIIVDPKMQPIGKVPLYRMMAANRKTPIADLMDEDFRKFRAGMMQEDVAYAFNQYHIISAPVVDNEGRLVGLITIDDAMEVLDEEADEDIRRLGGVGDESLTDSVWDTTKQRFPWLGVNLITAILASIVISLFSTTIEAIVALAVLMPIVASMGGNAGTQSLTVAVRALATKDLTATNAWRVIRREIMVGFLNGCLFAVIIGGVGLVWYGDPLLGAVLGLAMIGNLLAAGLAGIGIPIVLDKLGIDPALASGAFVTTVTDIVGFFAFLGLAAWILL
ncbi:MAG: magnesium transporter [Pseudomonadota bacterium]